MSEPAPPPRGLSWLYEVALSRLEKIIVVALLAAVICMSTAEILARNLDLNLFDRVAAQVASYFLAFHLGLFGAVLACRDARHIAIDAITPHLPQKARRWLGAVLLAVAAVTCVVLAWEALQYITVHIEPRATIVPGVAGFIWSERLWKAPLVIAFGWMALHFAVTAVSSARGTLPDHLHAPVIEPGHTVIGEPTPGDDTPTEDP